MRKSRRRRRGAVPRNDGRRKAISSSKNINRRKLFARNRKRRRMQTDQTAPPPPHKIERRYYVERILQARKTKDGKINLLQDIDELKDPYADIEYLIKWKGYDSTHNTWEPAQNLNHDLLKRVHEGSADCPAKPVPKDTRAILIDFDVDTTQIELSTENSHDSDFEELKQCLLCYGLDDDMVTCKDCDSSYHVDCLREKVNTTTIKSGGWKCIKCSTINSEDPSSLRKKKRQRCTPVPAQTSSTKQLRSKAKVIETTRKKKKFYCDKCNKYFRGIQGYTRHVHMHIEKEKAKSPRSAKTTASSHVESSSSSPLWKRGLLVAAESSSSSSPSLPAAGTGSELPLLLKTVMPESQIVGSNDGAASSSPSTTTTMISSSKQEVGQEMKRRLSYCQMCNKYYRGRQAFLDHVKLHHRGSSIHAKCGVNMFAAGSSSSNGGAVAPSEPAAGLLDKRQLAAAAADSTTTSIQRASSEKRVDREGKNSDFERYVRTMLHTATSTEIKPSLVLRKGGVTRDLGKSHFRALTDDDPSQHNSQDDPNTRKAFMLPPKQSTMREEKKESPPPPADDSAESKIISAKYRSSSMTPLPQRTAGHTSDSHSHYHLQQHLQKQRFMKNDGFGHRGGVNEIDSSKHTNSSTMLSSSPSLSSSSQSSSYSVQIGSIRLNVTASKKIRTIKELHSEIRNRARRHPVLQYFFTPSTMALANPIYTMAEYGAPRPSEGIIGCDLLELKLGSLEGPYLDERDPIDWVVRRGEIVSVEVSERKGRAAVPFLLSSCQEDLIHVSD
mmetsp:Transcript_17449/g.27882  ORF Transcript_17449/g.27882 Transcript_17449/m.27882 type:complete len:782 (+) Transcript_17449:84-2429(+)